MIEFKYLMMDWLLSGLRTDRLVSTDVGMFDRWMSFDELIILDFISYNSRNDVTKILFSNYILHVYDKKYNNLYMKNIEDFYVLFDSKKYNNLYMITRDTKSEEYLIGLL